MNFQFLVVKHFQVTLSESNLLFSIDNKNKKMYAMLNLQVGEIIYRTPNMKFLDPPMIMAQQ